MSIPRLSYTGSSFQQGAPLSVNHLNTPRGQVVKTEVRTGEVIKGESQISYVPFQKKVIEYEDRTYVEKRPIKRKVIEYEEKRYYEKVPREVTKIDYYAVENIKQYVKEIVPEKKIEMVAREKKVKKIQYIPVQKQTVHYPNSVNMETAIHEGSQILSHSGFQINTNTQYKPLNPAMIYNLGNLPQGYVESGNSRLMSQSGNAIFHTQSQNISGQNYQTNVETAFSKPEQIQENQ